MLAASCAALAVLTAVAASRPRPGAVASATTTVVVASRDLPPGTTLAPGDLRLVRLPATSAPPAALHRSAGLTGRTVAVAVAAGIPVTAGSLDVGHVLPPGTVATPVRLADPGETTVLAVGDRVDVLAAAGDPEDTGDTGSDAGSGTGTGTGSGTGSAAGSDSGGGGSGAPTVVAADVVVLALPDAGQGVAAADAGGLIVVATIPSQAAALARAAVDDRMSVTVRSS